MMVALLLYAYADGLRSSRVIERACVESIAFGVIAANQRHSAPREFGLLHMSWLLVDQDLCRTGADADAPRRTSPSRVAQAGRSPWRHPRAAIARRHGYPTFSIVGSRRQRRSSGQRRSLGLLLPQVDWTTQM
jgi:hypothetical protein